MTRNINDIFLRAANSKKGPERKSKQDVKNRRFSRSLMQVNHLELPSGEKNFNIVLGVMNLVRHEFQRIQNVFEVFDVRCNFTTLSEFSILLQFQISTSVANNEAESN